MCGLTGLFHPNGARHGAPVQASMLQAMTDALAHRGPDGEGLHRSEEHTSELQSR